MWEAVDLKLDERAERAERVERVERVERGERLLGIVDK